MKIPDLVKLSSVGVAAVLVGLLNFMATRAAGQPAPKRPNVVFIITDQQKPEAMSCADEFPMLGKRQAAKFQSLELTEK